MATVRQLGDFVNETNISRKSCDIPRYAIDPWDIPILLITSKIPIVSG